jgi:hypothetical protein
VAPAKKAKVLPRKKPVGDDDKADDDEVKSAENP